jgi:hypothetical protein
VEIAAWKIAGPSRIVFPALPLICLPCRVDSCHTLEEIVLRRARIYSRKTYIFRKIQTATRALLLFSLSRLCILLAILVSGHSMMLSLLVAGVEGESSLEYFSPLVNWRLALANSSRKCPRKWELRSCFIRLLATPTMYTHAQPYTRIGSDFCHGSTASGNATHNHCQRCRRFLFKFSSLSLSLWLSLSRR